MMQVNDLFLSPFVAGGRDPSGYDCFGLFQELCRRRGLPIPEQVQPSFPPEGAARDAEIMGQAVTCGWHPVDKPFAGCAVALRVGGWVAHMGMVLDDEKTFIHTNEKTGVTISRLDDPKWAKRIAGFYSHE